MLFATRLGLVPAGLRPAVGALGCGLLGAAYPQVFAMAVLGLTVTMPTCVAVLAMARLTMAIRVLTMAVLTWRYVLRPTRPGALARLRR